MNLSSPVQRPPRSPALVAIFFLFIATGMCGLVYQVVWQRYLLNIFGATIYSVSTVLSAFMGGLALGSWLFGRVADRTRRPLVVYGALEILIGVAALLVPAMLHVLDPVFTGVYRNFESNFYLFSAVRFVVVFAVLLVPTTMMGGTLPVLSRFLSPDGGGAGLRVGLLYALNTTGAVLGTILGGFFFIRWWGITRTVWLAAAINMTAGVIAILLSGVFVRAGSTAGGADPLVPARGDRRVRLVFAAFAVSGFVALGLEVAWSRSLVFTFEHLKNTTYSFTAMLATYLVGVAVGSAAITPFVERLRQPFRTYAAFQVLIGLLAMASFFVLYYPAYTLGTDWFQQFDGSESNLRWGAAVGLIFLRTAAVMFLPTFCMGMAFPIAVRAVVTASPTVGRDVGRLYAVNTVGAILGAAATGFLLMPLLGIANTIILLGGLQLVAGIALILGERESPAFQRGVWAVLGAACIVIALVYLPRPAHFQPDSPYEKTVFYREGPFATVAVAENTLKFRTIYVDNVGVAGTDPMLLTDQKSLAHVPMLLLPNPKSALTVGFGSGGASYSYTLYPELERIHCVEITKTVVEAAPTLTDSNRDVVMFAPEYKERTGRDPEGEPLWDDGGASGWYRADKRYRVILDDVRSHLRFTRQKYDIIATDCTDLRYKSNANLYDLEYFTLTREHLTDDGMVVVWMPLAGLSDSAFRVALRTFYRVFPEMEVFFMNNQPTHYILLLGTKKPLVVDPELVKRRLTIPGVQRDLGEIHLDRAEKILSCFIAGRERLKDYLEGDILNTEDFPYIEFESPRYGYGDEPLLDNLDGLFKLREDPARMLAPGATAEFRASLKRYYDAAPHIIEGHRDYRELRIPEATRAYQKAKEINPDDASVTNLLDFDELRRKVRGQPANSWARWMLGEVLAMQGRDGEAIAEFNSFVEYVEARPAAREPATMHFVRLSLERLAELYAKAGRDGEAKAYRERAARIPEPPAPEKGK